MKGFVAASPDNQKFPRSCDYVDCLHLFILSQQCHMTWLCWGINTGPLAADKTPLPIMHALSAADQNHILAMLDAGHTATKIAASTHYSLGTVLSFALNIALTSLSLVVVVLPSFPQPTSIMHNILSALGRLTMLLIWSKLFPTSPTNPSLPKLCIITSRWQG